MSYWPPSGQPQSAADNEYELLYGQYQNPGEDSDILEFQTTFDYQQPPFHVTSVADASSFDTTSNFAPATTEYSSNPTFEIINTFMNPFESEFVQSSDSMHYGH